MKNIQKRGKKKSTYTLTHKNVTFESRCGDD